jgi:hypothetical protein
MPVARAIRACVPWGFVSRSSCFRVRFVTMRQCCFILNRLSSEKRHDGQEFLTPFLSTIYRRGWIQCTL